MASIATIEAASRKLAIHSTTGEVMDARKWAVTEVSGGGGGGAVYGTNGNVYGGSHTAPIKSKTTNHAELFIRSKDGKEHVLKLKDENITVRTGSWVSLFWAIPEGKESGDYFAVLNHDTGALEFITSGVNKACSTVLTMSLGTLSFFVALLGAGVWIGGSAFFGFLLVMAFPAFLIWRWRLRSKFMGQVSALRGQIDGSRPVPTAVSAG